MAILGGASFGAYYLVKNPAHKDKKTEFSKTVINVKTMSVTLGTYPVKIEVMGQVIPTRSANLKAQIHGEIIHVDDEFIPGGFFKAGAEILHIDPSNYKLEVNIKKAAMRQANAALELELGQQKIARNELQIIEQSTGRKLKSNDLALRKPQLEQARANLNSAKAQLDLAKLNLERTKIKAPFNGIITQRNTDLGNIITTQDTIATLVNNDEYWVEIEIPTQDMVWLKTNDKATISLNNNLGTYEGILLKPTGSLNKINRMASMLISVKNPLSGDAPLILGDYVYATLVGRNLKNTARIPVNYLRGDNMIWLERNGKLIIQRILIAYQDRRFAYVTKGLNAKDKIITSNIITPVHSMAVKVQNNE